MPDFGRGRMPCLHGEPGRGKRRDRANGRARAVRRIARVGRSAHGRRTLRQRKRLWWRCARGTHPFPSRTRRLRPGRPMVLCWRRHGRAGGCQIHGGIAQLGEHLPCKQGVKGSKPFISTVTEKKAFAPGLATAEDGKLAFRMTQGTNLERTFEERP